MNYTTPIFLLIWFTFIALLWNHRAITKVFHLVDKRSFLNSKETYQKLNQLFEYTDAHFYTFDMFDSETRIVVTLDHKTKEETISARFDGKNLDEVVSKAHWWAVERGYIPTE